MITLTGVPLADLLLAVACPPTLVALGYAIARARYADELTATRAERDAAQRELVNAQAALDDASSTTSELLAIHDDVMRPTILRYRRLARQLEPPT